MKLFIMQFSPVLRHCLLPWPKYFPEHHILQHPQPMFSLYCERPKFHTHGSNLRQFRSYESLKLIHSFHWHVQNATIPCRPQELLPFLSVMYFFLPPFSTNYYSILSHLILPSIY